LEMLGSTGWFSRSRILLCFGTILCINFKVYSIEFPFLYRGSSLDDIGPEALRYGGSVGDLAAARFILGLWANGCCLPATWLQPKQLDVYYGAPRDPLAVES
ncbi:MAG: hypothetical protein AAF170_10450, partial [Bacteroidota bacterium]